MLTVRLLLARLRLLLAASMFIFGRCSNQRSRISCFRSATLRMSLFLPVTSLNSCSRCIIPSARRAASTASIPLRRIFPQNSDIPSSPSSVLSRNYFNASSPARRHQAAPGLGTSPFATVWPRFNSSKFFTRSFNSSSARSSAATLSHEAAAQEHRLPPLPTLTSPVVAYYLIGIATLVFAIVVIGGLTRLTESGLSITEWNLVTGTLPPLNEDDWIEELRKYRLSPEGRLCARSSLTRYRADALCQNEQEHHHV